MAPGKNALLLVGLTLALAGGLAFVFTQEPGDAGEDVAPAAVETPAADEAEPVEIVEASAPVAPEETAALPVPAQPAAEPDRAAVDSPYEQELAAAHWVEGVLVFPEGVPADERAFVLAKGKPFEHGPLHRVEVGGDGRFRVAFSETSRSGWLKLEASYLYLEKSSRWRRGKTEEPVRLEPLLGARLVGKLVAPDGWLHEVGVPLAEEIDLRGLRKVGRHEWSSGNSYETQVDENQGYAFNALPTDLVWSLSCLSDRFPWVEHARFTLEPGITRELDLALERGVDVEGRVVDAGGAPVEGATVSAGLFASYDFRAMREAETDAYGAFALQGVEAGRVEVTVTAQGFLEHEWDAGERDPGDRVAGVELVLDRGNHVAGVVRWPDGKPAAGASLVVVVHEPEDAEPSRRYDWGRSDEVKASAGKDGGFVVSGLPAGTYDVRAEARPAVPEPPPGKGKRRGAPEPSMAEVKGVLPGTEGLVLTLDPGLALLGRVTDDTGEAIDRFRVRVGRPKESEMFDPRFFEAEFSKYFREETGEFELPGIPAGEWEVVVQAKGYNDSPRQRVTVGEDAPPLEIVLRRNAILAGQVVDTAGVPVAGANVLVRTEQRDDAYFFGFGAEPAATTGELGEFEVSVEAGELEVTAEAAGHGPSRPHKLRAVSGERHEGLVLELGPGGRILGVFEGPQHAGRRITLNSTTQMPPRFDYTESDEAGRFQFVDLPADTYQISVQPTDNERANVEASEDADSFLVWEDLRHRTVAEVGPGETVEVVLGAGERDAIVVSGTVTLGGSPLAEAIVMARYAGASFGSVRTKADTDAEGRFRLELDHGGSYLFEVNRPGASYQLSKRVEVPAEGLTDLALEFTASGITGRVTDESGAPEANALVHALSLDAIANANGLTPESRVATDAEGRYEFAGLPPGTYTLRVERTSISHFPGVAHVTRAVRSGIVVEGDEPVTGVDFVLGPGSRLSGQVVDASGGAVGYSRVLIWSEDGSLLTGSGSLRSNDLGAFEVTELPAGSVAIAVTRKSRVSRVEEGLELPAGGTAEVEVTLDEGTVLDLSLKSGDGAAWLVRDERGRDWSLVTPGILASSTSQLGRPEARIGPVPPGTYTVEAILPGGERRRETVRVSHELEVSVEL